jgi:hypothetical protein
MGYQQSGSVVVIDDFAEDFDKETVFSVTLFPNTFLRAGKE